MVPEPFSPCAAQKQQTLHNRSVSTILYANYMPWPAPCRHKISQRQDVGRRDPGLSPARRAKVSRSRLVVGSCARLV